VRQTCVSVHALRPRPDALATLGLALACLALAGCGEVAPHGTGSDGPKTTASVNRTVTSTHRPARSEGARAPTPSAQQSVVARIDASSDRIVAEGKLHIAAGAPSNAEVRHELEIARKDGIRLPSGDSAQSFENAPANDGPSVDVETPETAWNPRGKPIADWIVPVLAWAYQHGWHGAVTSGYRTYYEQAQLNAAGAFSAPAGLSNHETTVYPGGAVDVTEPSGLIVVLRGYTGPHKLIGGMLGPVDPEHFSATGY
jgi:hypothetical protein